MSIQQTSTVNIIGSGPAGLCAAIYTARAGLQTTLFAGTQPLGQLVYTEQVENYPGALNVSGYELMQHMLQQVQSLPNITVLYEDVIDIRYINSLFHCYTNSKNVYAPTCIVATGASTRWLNLPSENKYKNYGVHSCALCDGSFYHKKVVAVVGGGNSAVESALYLSGIVSQVILIHRRDTLRAEQILQDKLFKLKNIFYRWNTTVEEIIGTDNPMQVTGLKLLQNGIHSEVLEVNGVFINIGHIRQTELLKHLVAIDTINYTTVCTTMLGLFVAGEVMDTRYKQAITAAGQGCMAAIETFKWLQV